MYYVEDNGKKVAAVLCVASCFPVVATVYAMETQPGWHGDKYINTDATIAKGWQEIEGKSYFFDEKDGSVDKETTSKAVVASVSANILGDVADDVVSSTISALNGTQETVQTIDQVNVNTTLSLEETIEENITETLDAQETLDVQEIPGEQEIPNESLVVEVPADQIGPVSTMAEYVEVPESVEHPAYQPRPVETMAVVNNNVPISVDAPAVDNSYQYPTIQQPTTTPSTPVQTPSNSDNPYHQLNQSIANAAIGLVGVTDGQWCTQVVQQALAGAGVQDAYQLWPDQYADMYGYYTDTPEAGNLVYYYNGGRGVDHIAVYIGDGMAVHGNYGYGDNMGKTVIASVIINGGEPQYIQVCR